MKKIVFALGLTGLALISYAAYRGVVGRHHIVAHAYANTQIELPADGADKVIPARVEASDPGSSDGNEQNAQAGGREEIPSATLQAESDIIQAWNCFNSDKQPCPGYATTSLHDYQIDVLTHMQAIAENAYVAILRDPALKDSEHEAFARDLVSNPQPELQLIGIKMLEVFDPSQSNLDAISNCLAHTLSEELFEQGMVVLNAKYGNGGAFTAQIRDTLEHQIQFGIDETTSHRAAQELYQYLDKTSFEHFLTLEQKLLPISKERYSALNSVLNEYAAAHHL